MKYLLIICAYVGEGAWLLGLGAHQYNSCNAIMANVVVKQPQSKLMYPAERLHIVQTSGGCRTTSCMSANQRHVTLGHWPTMYLKQSKCEDFSMWWLMSEWLHCKVDPTWPFSYCKYTQRLRMVLLIIAIYQICIVIIIIIIIIIIITYQADSL